MHLAEKVTDIKTVVKLRFKGNNPWNLGKYELSS